MNGNNQPEDLAELQSRGFWALEHPGQIEPGGAAEGLKQLLRLWQYSAFGHHTAWAVFIPRRETLEDETRVLVREVLWDRPRDLERIITPLEWLRQKDRTTPSLNIQDREVAYSRLSALVDELAQLPVPVAGIKPLWGLDGETFGFEYSNSSFLRARLEWWCDGPTEWKAFTDCVARLRVLLHSLFNDDGIKDT